MQLIKIILSESAEGQELHLAEGQDILEFSPLEEETEEYCQVTLEELFRGRHGSTVLPDLKVMVQTAHIAQAIMFAREFGIKTDASINLKEIALREISAH